MQLNPMRKTSKPTYPVKTGKESSVRSWMRQSLAAACTSGAILLGGCYGANPYHERTDEPQPVSDIVTILEVLVEQPLLPDDPQPMDGGMMAPAFSCDNSIDWNVRTVPAYLEGSLCNDGAAYAVVDITTRDVHAVTLGIGSEYTFVSIRNPSGEEVAELSPDRTSLDIDFTEGQWTFVATAADPIDNPNSWFEVTVGY